MFLLSTLFLLTIFTATLYWYYKSSRKERRQQLSGLKPEPIFGNLRSTGITSGRVAFHEALATLKSQYGDVYSFWLGPCYSIVLSRLDHVQRVLTDRHTYDLSITTANTFGAIFPAGLIALKGDDWKRHARFVLPMLKRAKVLPYLETIVSCTDSFINEHLAKRDGEIHTDLIEKCQQLLLNIIAFIAFDYDLEASEESNTDDLRNAFNDFVRLANQFMLLGSLPPWIGKLMLIFSWKYKRALRTVKRYVMNIINEERTRQKEELTSGRPRNLIASLVSADKGESSTREGVLSSNEIFDEVNLLILAGFETTSTALSWFIFYMSKYPEVQKKIKAELTENNITPHTMLTTEILDSLIYVECVTKEVLRFAPITVALSRQATCDDIIDDIEIKKGDIVMIAAQNIHRDPRYWKVDPSQFIPERFLGEDKNPPQYAILTFGGGHRACAGQDLAFLELKTIIARLMQRVTFFDPGDEANNSGGAVQRITCFPKYMAVRTILDQETITE